MSKPLALSQIITRFRESWQGLPDHRKANNNTKYKIVDACLAAFSTFFMQLPSFLAYQRTMKQSKGVVTVIACFRLSRSPAMGKSVTYSTLLPRTSLTVNIAGLWMN